MKDLTIDLDSFEAIVKELDKYIEKIIVWKHPMLKTSDSFNLNIPNIEPIDLLETIESEK